MLTSGNSELRKDGIFTWSIPALNARLTNGNNFVTCPNAGICANLCYARSGTYMFSNVRAAHLRNLERVLADLDQWRDDMILELKGRKFRNGKSVRIHDTGDFFSNEYFIAWCRIAYATPDVLFYAYTKEVAMVKSLDDRRPDNLVIIFSMGGKQDHLIDVEYDRHADVFPTLEALEAAGYTDQSSSDLLAATLPTNRIGIVSNNIRHLKKRQGESTFSGLQEHRSKRIGLIRRGEHD